MRAKGASTAQTGSFGGGADRTAFANEGPYRRSEMEFGVAADAYRSAPDKRATRNGAILLTGLIAIVAFLAALAVGWLAAGEANLVVVLVAAVLGVLVLASARVSLEWERYVVMRLGRFNRLAGPGLFFIVPFVEFCTLRIDQRTQVTPFGAEETLTADLVPLDVDAVLYWMIWDPEKACSEVEDCYFAVALAAQTTLRDAIGRASVADVVMRRHSLDKQLEEAIEEKVSAWGITVLSVEVRDIIMPKELQTVMSLEAQAESRKNARLTLMEAERDVAAILDEVAETYRDNDLALELRRMHLTYEGASDSQAAMVVPSAYTEGFAGGDKSAG